MCFELNVVFDQFDEPDSFIFHPKPWKNILLFIYKNIEKSYHADIIISLVVMKTMKMESIKLNK